MVLTQGCRKMDSVLPELIKISSDFPELKRIWSGLLGARLGARMIWLLSVTEQSEFSCSVRKVSSLFFLLGWMRLVLMVLDLAG